MAFVKRPSPSVSGWAPHFTEDGGNQKCVWGGEPMWERIQAVEEARRELTAFQLCGSGLVAYPL